MKSKRYGDGVYAPLPQTRQGPDVLQTTKKQKKQHESLEQSDDVGVEQEQVFVFGSNLAGRHGKGAALYARRHHGAVYGQGEGFQGASYAIPTKDAALKPRAWKDIQSSVETFLAFAKARPTSTFRVTPIGCGLAGFSPTQIAPMFVKAPPNVVLPSEFQDSALAQDTRPRLSPVAIPSEISEATTQETFYSTIATYASRFVTCVQIFEAAKNERFKKPNAILMRHAARTMDRLLVQFCASKQTAPSTLLKKVDVGIFLQALEEAQCNTTAFLEAWKDATSTFDYKLKPI